MAVGGRGGLAHVTPTTLKDNQRELNQQLSDRIRRRIETETDVSMWLYFPSASICIKIIVDLSVNDC